MLDRAVQMQLDSSDLVQETFLKAHRQFAGFVGRDEPQLMAWLQQILVHTLADQARYHRRRSRNVRRHVSLEELLEQAGGAAQQALADSLPSASSLAIRRERPSCWPTPWKSCPPTIERFSCCVTSSTFLSTTSPSG